MRLFTFGCSCSMFFWPTWADIVATDLDIEYHNFAMPGIGNVGIQSRIVEADMKYKLTKDDMVLIMWSSWSREDRFKGNSWQTGGSVFNNHLYDDEFINKHWSWENDIVKNSTAIYITNKAYGDIIKHQGSITIFPSFVNNSDITPFLSKLINRFVKLDDDLTRFYRENITMPECWNMSTNSQFNGQSSDPHPDVKCHLEYVENIIYPNLGLEMKDGTRQLFTQIQNELAMAFKPTDSLQVLEDKTIPILAKYNIKKSSI